MFDQKSFQHKLQVKKKKWLVFKLHNVHKESRKWELIYSFLFSKLLLGFKLKWRLGLEFGLGLGLGLRVESFTDQCSL